MPDPKAHYSVSQKILFRHCDPAGIVFYPRYFEIINDAVEAFFAGPLDWPFEEMHKDHAAPTVQIEARFDAVSRHGDMMDIGITVVKLGRSSLGLRIAGHCAGELRFTANSTMVCVDALMKPTPWPPGVRGNLEQLMGDAQ